MREDDENYVTTLQLMWALGPKNESITGPTKSLENRAPIKLHTTIECNETLL